MFINKYKKNKKKFQTLLAETEKKKQIHQKEFNTLKDENEKLENRVSKQMNKYR